MNTTDLLATLSRPVVPGRDHIRGSFSSDIKLVEYGDYECPSCRAAHAVVNALQARMHNRLCFVYRHFPLATVHPNAKSAAEAAEAAGRQHKFWGMHDRLFTTYRALTHDVLITHATALELDVVRFSNEVLRHVYLARVRDDFMSGVRSGVNGTPTFYINGVRHDGVWDFATLFTALDRAAVGTKVPVARR